MADVNWRHGSLVTPPTPEAPESVGDDDSIAALLDEAEDIINNAGPEIRSAVDRSSSRRTSPGSWLKKLPTKATWWRRRT